MPKKKTNHRARRVKTAIRRDRRARLRLERNARGVEMELDSMRHQIAVAHARAATQAEADELRAADSGRGWNEDRAWSRHYESSYQWCSEWSRGALVEEMARLAALPPGEGPLDFLARDEPLAEMRQ